MDHKENRNYLGEITSEMSSYIVTEVADSYFRVILSGL